jgi:hypothetical protein
VRANKAAALASYSKMADDDTLRQLADRTQARAVRHMGELLKKFDGRGDHMKKDGTRPFFNSNADGREPRHELDSSDNARLHADDVTELWEVQHILLNLASITRAQSLQGALFQLALLTDTLHVDLFQNIPTEESKIVFSITSKNASA